MKKAIKEFEDDNAFEQKVVEENKSYKKKKRRKQRIGFFMCF